MTDSYGYAPGNEEWDWTLLKDGEVVNYLSGGEGFMIQIVDQLNSSHPLQYPPGEIREHIQREVLRTHDTCSYCRASGCRDVTLTWIDQTGATIMTRDCDHKCDEWKVYIEGRKTSTGYC